MQSSFVGSLGKMSADLYLFVPNLGTNGPMQKIRIKVYVQELFVPQVLRKIEI